MNPTAATATIVFALTIVLAAPGAALHCNGDIVTIDTGAETLYLDDRSDEVGEIDHWLYLEDNGIEGLQSGADPIFLQDHCGPYHIYCLITDPCSHDAPDRIIF